MKFKLIKKLNSGVRIGEVETAHGIIHTPFFMPVATIGSVKSVSPQELITLGAEIVLSNTYHLYLRPGEKNIQKLGGLHKFMNWNGPILTDSGGYQVFSLGDRGAGKKSLVRISEDGVEFKSHLDGTKHMFTPEKVIQIQLDLGVDILMPLDFCPSGKATLKEVKRAVDITINWAKRSKRYFDKQTEELKPRRFRNVGIPIEASGNLRTKEQKSNEANQASKANKAGVPALFGIVQGGLDPVLRKHCAKELLKLNFDGYSVGGLAVDHETRDMWQTVKLMREILPEDKPRYLMGVGTPDDIIAAISLGMDMFDCVLPTRLARHGSVYVRCQMSDVRSKEKYILINLLNSKYRTDGEPIDKECQCPACAGGFTKAYISHLIRENEILGLRLATLHNLHQYLVLIKEIQSK